MTFRNCVEGVVLLFVLWAFGWQVCVALFLVLWLLNMATARMR